MNAADLKRALDRLSNEQFEHFKRDFGGDGQTRQWYVDGFIESWEHKLCQMLGMPTETEKQARSAKAGVPIADIHLTGNEIAYLRLADSFDSPLYIRDNNLHKEIGLSQQESLRAMTTIIHLELVEGETIKSGGSVIADAACFSGGTTAKGRQWLREHDARQSAEPDRVAQAENWFRRHRTFAISVIVLAVIGAIGIVLGTTNQIVEFLRNIGWIEK